MPKISRKLYRHAKSERQKTELIIESKSDAGDNAATLAYSTAAPQISAEESEDLSKYTSSGTEAAALNSSSIDDEDLSVKLRVLSDVNCSSASSPILVDSESDSETDILSDDPDLTEINSTFIHSEPNKIENQNALVKDLLSNWALKNNITLQAMDQLLKILKLYHSDLPNNARSLLHTPRQINTKIVNPGRYYHFGLDKCIHRLLKSYNSVNSLHTIEVFINIDGLPLSKSSSSQVYPILCCLVQCRKHVSVVGVYHGYEKPQDPKFFYMIWLKT